MKKTLLGALLTLASQCYASAPLEGISYGDQAAPSGKEWESPEHFAHNKEQPRATFYSFQDKKSARKVLPKASEFYQSLDGQWKFNWVNHPDLRPKNFHQPSFDVSAWDNIKVPSNWNLAGLQKDGTQKYGTPIYCNQPVIFKHSVRVDDWKGGVMRTPPKHWTTYKDRNEVGSYRRDIDIPADWDGRETFIKFAGVDSFFYLWINGKYVGFSKNSRNAAIFNITKYLKKGKNVVAAEVYRNSDGSFLEAQDMFRLPGIFRTVSLHSTPKVQIRDLYVVPQLDDQYQNGSLKISADIRNLSKKDAANYKLVYSLYANKLYSEENKEVKGVQAHSAVPALATGKAAVSTALLKIKAPRKWSAELPYRYTLVAQLKNAKNKTIETVSTIVGFREVVIKDTLAKDDEFGLAGRYFYVNGKPVKLKGVNRHETAPATGHTLTRKQMKDEIMLMKRANINHVRNSHYPPAEDWYHLCDKYGIYLEDEANIESHEYYYGTASLSHPPEWKNAHVGRVMEMIHQNKNHASIVIWSPGNEAGPGINFVHAYNAIKTVDLTRPVQYERNNNIVDMGSNQYPSIGWVKGAVKGNYNIKYPFHISEYAHSMGNACGNLVDYWEAMESTNFFCGGAIWDWVDQSIYNYEKDGTKYLAYGGNFGDFPNDGQFVMNGILFGDREPKPQYFEVKKVYQHIDAKVLDLENGKVEVFNKYYFKDLSDYQLVYSLYKDGVQQLSEKLYLPAIPAREKATVTLPYNFKSLDASSEYFVKVQFQLKAQSPWAKKAFVQAEEQFALKAATARPSIAQVTEGTVQISETDELKTVTGKGFTAKFSLKDGSLYSLVYGDKTIIADGNGPKLDAFRAFTNNDNWFYGSWFERGLHNLKHKATSSKVKVNKDGTATLAFTVVSQAPNAARILGGTSSGLNKVEELTKRKFDENDFRFVTNQIWTVYADGSIELQSSITANESKFILPRLGYAITVPSEFSKFSYYGRGPVENYADRKTAQFVEKYESTVAAQFANFPKPQEMANREDVRWCALTDKSGAGAVFIATDKLSVNALPYTSLEMTLASHPHKLAKSSATVLHLDTAVTGLGGNSCGQGGPLGHDRVYAGQNNMGFIIRPAGKDLTKIANVSAAGQIPIGIARSRTGVISLSTAKKDAKFMYSINDATAQDYKGAFTLRKGASVTAWYKGDKASAFTVVFKKIESIDTVVVFASSQEPGGGSSARNLTDGNSNTIWHSMYSVTVAQYPHWVDFDSGEAKNIKGFIYLPRQDGGENGDIKDYNIQVSMDGKNWGKVIQKGRFDRSKKEKKVLFKTPVKARYIRFKGLNSQNGADFAGGAEFNVLAD